MQYIVRNRRRLRPATGELIRATSPVPVVQAEQPPCAEGSGLHRRPLVTEINRTVPFSHRDR